MISVGEAHKIIEESIPGPSPESVPLSDASGRVLAERVRAGFPQPLFDNSAMDGFAVRWEDTEEASKGRPVKLRLKGEVFAGIPQNIRVGEGECTQVMTGASVPEGASAVVRVENTSGFSSDDVVQIYTPVEEGENIRFRGEEVREDELLLEKGTRIGASEIGVLAAFGYSQAGVFRLPRMAICSTGDELKPVGEPLEKGQIYDSNLHLLGNLVKCVVANPTLQENIADNRSQLRHFLTNAFASCDMVISSGGVSMGRHDYVRDILLELEVNGRFWKVAQKPGKPFFFGTAGKTLLFGLPGNPVSAFICFMEYVWPTCERWMGIKPKPKIQAVLATPFPRDAEKHRFLFGRVWVEKTQLMCAPTEKLGSHMLTSTIEANGILEAGPGKGPLPEGEPATVSIIPWKSIMGES